MVPWHVVHQSLFSFCFLEGGLGVCGGVPFIIIRMYGLNQVIIEAFQKLRFAGLENLLLLNYVIRPPFFQSCCLYVQTWWCSDNTFLNSCSATPNICLTVAQTIRKCCQVQLMSLMVEKSAKQCFWFPFLANLVCRMHMRSQRL